MEEILLRFPHLGEKVLDKLDMKSLEICRQVSKSWQAKIDGQYLKLQCIRKISKYSDGTKEALEKV